MTRRPQIRCCGLVFPSKQSSAPRRPPRSFYTPRPLGPRTRALTAEYSRRTTSNNSQHTSKLLNLPPEIRDQIWIEVLGGISLDLVLINGLYQQFGCMYPGGKIERGLLSLPMTCRQLYVETIDVLYSCNKYILRSQDAVLHLQNVLLPHRVDAILELDLHLAMAAPPVVGSPEAEKWTVVWKKLSTFSGLRSLKVEIMTPELWKHDWAVNESRLLKELMVVHRPERLVLVLDWRQLLGNLEVGSWKIERHVRED